MTTRRKNKRKNKAEPLTRSQVMSRVRAKNTRPEMVVRRALWAAGLRYRLHDPRLAGHPDIVLPSRRIVVFVHGCFWHGHEGCPRHRIPKSRVDWWMEKINRNKTRDVNVRATLASAGWIVMVIWECESEVGSKLADLVSRIKAAPVPPKSRRRRSPSPKATPAATGPA